MSVRVVGAVLVCMAVAAAGCAGPGVRVEEAVPGQYHPAGGAAVRAMLDGVSSLVKKSPATCSADFNVSGSTGARTYRLAGSVEFDRSGRLMHIAFKDFIFKSTVTMFFQEGDTIRVYYPVDKKMFVDNTRTFDLANYGGTSLNYSMIYDVATGTFPLIKGYRVREGLAADNGNGSLLVLENGAYYETISFKQGVPEKILLVSRKTGEKIEVYLKKIVNQGDSVFFSNIMVISAGSRLRLEINFNRVSLNAPVKVKTVRDVTIPGSVQVYTM